jgi:hypothetical protein
MYETAAAIGHLTVQVAQLARVQRAGFDQVLQQLNDVSGELRGEIAAVAGRTTAVETAIEAMQREVQQMTTEIQALKAARGDGPRAIAQARDCIVLAPPSTRPGPRPRRQISSAGAPTRWPPSGAPGSGSCGRLAAAPFPPPRSWCAFGPRSRRRRRAD